MHMVGLQIACTFVLSKRYSPVDERRRRDNSGARTRNFYDPFGQRGLSVTHRAAEMSFNPFHRYGLRARQEALLNASQSED